MGNLAELFISFTLASGQWAVLIQQGSSLASSAVPTVAAQDSAKMNVADRASVAVGLAGGPYSYADGEGYGASLSVTWFSSRRSRTGNLRAWASDAGGGVDFGWLFSTRSGPLRPNFVVGASVVSGSGYSGAGPHLGAGIIVRVSGRVGLRLDGIARGYLIPEKGVVSSLELGVTILPKGW